jgi:hypothetical protein
MAIYSTLFYSGVQPQGSHATLYTVPAGFVVILRDVDALSTTTANAQILLTEAAAANAFASLNVATVLDSAQWRGRQVFPAGYAIGINTVVGAWVVRASGYLLTV